MGRFFAICKEERSECFAQASNSVIPAKAGIQCRSRKSLSSRLLGDDKIFVARVDKNLSQLHPRKLTLPNLKHGVSANGQYQ